VVGILNIDGYRANQFKESHVPIATDFARQAAIALHNAELYGEVIRRAELLSSIHEVGVSIVSSLELEEVLRTVSTSILEVLNAQHVRVFLYNATTDTFTLASALDYGGKFQVIAANPNPPRKDGLTATVARSGKSLVISDSRSHPLFRGLDQFQYFGAIVGTPLKKRDQVLGVINVAYREPHRFTSHELDALQLLSLQAAVALDNARLYAIEVKQIEQELNIARRIQQGFLPRKFPELPGWSISAVCLPARETGGDFYEFVRRRDNHWGLAIGDVSGKSIQAAMLMSVAQSLVGAKGSDHYSPGKVMAETNRLLYEDMPSSAFVAISYILISEGSNVVTFSNGGQLAPFLVPAKKGAIHLLETPGAHWPLGVLADVEYEELSLSLEEGDMLVFFTDGLIERMNPKRQMLGFDGVRAALEDVRGWPTNRVLKHLLVVAENFAMGTGAHDDITLLLIQRLK
jgi:serine phosphatase RsbU (regulator of sigma subunit)